MPGIYDTQTWRGVDPRLQMAFMAMAAQAPGEVGLTSGWRSNATQADLYRRKPGLAAPPGKSNHEFGLALDITFENAATRRWVHQNAARFGLWFPMDYEPWHVQLIGVDRHNVNGGARGGGRDAFSQPPDGRFVNPYDVLSGQMAMEDNTDPLTQFGRLVGAMTSPMDAALGTPEVPGLVSPDVESGTTGSGDVNVTDPSDVPLEVGNGPLS